MKSFSSRRVWGIVLRHLYNLKNNFDRIVDTFYWPAVDMLLFGLTIAAFTDPASAAFISVAIGICLWFVVWRSQSDMTVNLLEEFWSDNLANIFASPITVYEWVFGLLAISIIKLAMTLVLLGFLAYVLYAVNITSVSWIGLLFIASLLLTGWSIGFFITGLFMRYGTSLQTLAWAGPVILMPVSGTYFSISLLPQWAQTIAKVVPSSYVFESLRSVVIGGTFDPNMMVISFALNAVYLVLSISFFITSFERAKVLGIAHLK
ncbi:ABC transporter permease [Candidatus Microgenomates bacterium]|nr:MAG: ABC transporter permease [Candidatus Microgenomates bacterium]